MHIYHILRGDFLATTKAHIKASNKYNKENYKKIQANIKPEDYNLIDNYCSTNDISKAQLIVKSIKYIIENNIDICNY